MARTSQSLGELASGRVASTTKYCLNCGDAFRQVTVGTGHVTGCVSCWRKNNFVGSVPQLAAPLGINASEGIWEAETAGDLHRRRESRRDSSLSGFGEVQRSATSTALHRQPSSEVAVRKSWSHTGERRNSKGAPVPASEAPRSSLLAVPAEGQQDMGLPGQRRRTSRSNTLGSTALLRLQREEGASPANTPGAAEILTKGRQSERPKTPTQPRTPSGLKDTLQPAMPDLNAARRPSLVSKLSQVSGGLANQAVGPRPLPSPAGARQLPAAIHVDEGVNTSNRTGFESLDERKRSVVRRLCQNRHVKEAMSALVGSVDAHRLSSSEGLRNSAGGPHMSKADVQKGLRKFGVVLSALDLDAVLRSFDLEGNGEVNVLELAEVVKGWFHWFPDLRPKDQESETEMVSGFAVGSRVRSLVSMNSHSDEREEGVVVGAGATPGTLAVKFEGSGQTLSVKPAMIVAAPRNSTRGQRMSVMVASAKPAH